MATPASCESSRVSARTTTSTLRRGRRRARSGSTVMTTPFGASAADAIRTTTRPGGDVADPNRPLEREALELRRALGRAERDGGGDDRDLLLDRGTEIDQAGARGRGIEVAALRRPDEEAAELGRAETRTALREDRSGPGGDCGGGARPTDGAEADLALVTSPRLGRRDRDACRNEVGLEPAAEREPTRRERGDRRHPARSPRPSGPDRDGHGNPGAEERAHLCDETSREPGDRHTVRDVEAERARRQRPVDEHGEGACGGRLLHGLLGKRAARKERGPTSDRTRAVRVEEPGDPLCRRGSRHRDDVGRHGPGRCPPERQRPLEQDPQPGPHLHAHGRHRGTRVRGGDRERLRSAAGAGDAPVARPRPAVVSGGDDDERVERGRARDRLRQWAVGERRVGLDDADEGDAGRVERVPVVVRVDRGLEAGEDLVGARVDGVPALGVGLPAGDADGQDRRAGRDAVQAPGPSEPVTIPASSVAWRSGRPGIVGCGWATAPLPGLSRSMPVCTLPRR